MSTDLRPLVKLAAAAVVPPIAGAAFVALTAVVLQEYGWVLFLLAPAVMGFVSTVIYAPNGDKSFWKCLGFSFYYILFVSFLILITAIEGLICVAMSLPIVIPASVVGVGLAYVVTNHYSKPRVGFMSSIALLMLIPFMLGFEISNRSQPTTHQVVSTVEINAPIETVWKNVIEFPQIEKQPEGVLSLGFAYPVNARIEGTGVGAIRYCNFNTGAFVEPITAWQEPNLLAFDVAAQPAPMVELSPYEHLHTAHLEYIRSQKGQFRLFEKDGKTVVEGTTFYTHSVAPDLYWKLFSDGIIHRIHRRVLDHIKEVSEN